ncbi:hypothetical protein DFA_09164 [Cavenderia fasciculata]|uniref:Molybdopterin cofactor biosynthesis C (MoaC) domain-containing protein n=1 Tax=Cavenderia fasciculata TaxID=261658 RepID=F4Q6V7_CACFS|nr:uncharacterized protein DFA_09164 [Cavenderia fasciculata]EGG16139.1 hypothetical protein DFA_09164 [Cavenderia fasciculata]|eukprot:XP_004352592.1 hypothetical protein DFA_09164 [Cavenderia fasciculata]
MQPLQDAKTIRLTILPTITNQFPFNNLRKLNIGDIQSRDCNILQFISTLELPLVKLILPLFVRPALPFLAQHASSTIKQSLETIQLEEDSDPLLLQQFPNIKHIIVVCPSFYEIDRDSLFHPKYPFSQSNVQKKDQIFVHYKRQIPRDLRISKCSRNLDDSTSETEQVIYEQSIWSHIKKEFNGIKNYPNNITSIVIDSIDRLYLGALEHLVRSLNRTHVQVDCTVSCSGKTGVEMEALTGASVASLTIYDMCKALSHDIIIKETKLINKLGGKSDINKK